MIRPVKSGNAIFLFLWLCFIHGAPMRGKTPKISLTQIDGYRTVSVRPVISNQRRAIAVDRDGRVVLLALQKDGRIKYLKTLGFEEELPDNFPFADALPKDEVPTELRRLSSPEQSWRMWIVLTIGFDELRFLRKKGYFTISNFLYVFRESPEGESILLREPLGEVTELVVDDVNGDQTTEIAVQYVEAGASPVTLLRIWQVQSTGELQPFSLESMTKDLTEAASSVVVGLRDYRDGDPGLYIEERIAFEHGWLLVTRYYKWNQSEKRYELERIVKTQERVVK